MMQRMLLSVFPCAACSSLLWGVCWPGVGAPSDLLRCCWLLFSVVAPVEAPGQPPTMGSGSPCSTLQASRAVSDFRGLLILWMWSCVLLHCSFSWLLVMWYILQIFIPNLSFVFWLLTVFLTMQKFLFFSLCSQIYNLFFYCLWILSHD